MECSASRHFESTDVRDSSTPWPFPECVAPTKACKAVAKAKLGDGGGTGAGKLQMGVDLRKMECTGSYLLFCKPPFTLSVLGLASGP